MFDLTRLLMVWQQAIYPEYESEDVKVCQLATIIQRPEVTSDRFAAGESSGKDEEERRPPCSSERRRHSRGWICITIPNLHIVIQITLSRPVEWGVTH